MTQLSSLKARPGSRFTARSATLRSAVLPSRGAGMPPSTGDAALRMIEDLQRELAMN